ncbi:F-box/kelch-repeat protein At3g23880-like [Quercus robur]|uniref:F-box/kelch-repeat protein At3g23880-like n=1 Tax=Quercus robur TaxID=38942 RepID=UPI0021625A5E|nr:F-box/kelch-repeat protein At3g23880-like [Quercus robur]
MMSKLRNLSSERLPHDVVIDILTRLPVKSLIRFRCVSKSWYSTITDPIFITKHLNLQLNKAKSLSSNNNHNGFLLYTHDKQLYTAACNGGPTLTLTEVSKFQIPFPVDHYMVDHCNGMFLIYGNRDALIYLWNPNIQKFKMLTIAEGRSGYSPGLAYHCQNNDFKILKIVCNNKGPRFEAKVYALSTDLWRRIEFSVESIPNLGSILDIQYEPFLFFNGALYSMAYTRGKNNTNNFILSFDVNDEIFREIRLPENYLDRFIFDYQAVHQLVVFKGSLALIVFGPPVFDYEDGDVLDKCDIWVMGQYGVVESWTKKTVGLKRIKNFFGCTESGQLLIMMPPGRTVSYDPESLYDNNIGISSPNWMAYTTDLMESLVLLDHK